MAEENLNIVFVLYPNLTQLDFTGPLQVLSRLPGASVHLAAKTLDPVSTDAVLTIPPTVTFADCPPADL
ncbi:MAG: DJ-1/PfpI family protein, partial [Alphaproteobacteria bacterium]|nr:DJ-1/PfpI family protein [Alphaproteobacteria bacterium]